MTMPSPHPLLAAALAAVLVGLASCTSDRQDDGFSAVQARVPEHLHWNHASREDAQVDQAIARLLAQPLTAPAAVQIAVLSNPGLQATYEDLGLAQAEVVRAGLLKNPLLDVDAEFAVGGGVRLEASVMEDFLSILYLPMHRRMAHEAFQAAQLRVAAAVIDLGTAVARAVIAYQQAAAELACRQALLACAQADADLASRLRAAGNLSMLMLFEHRDRCSAATLAVAAAQLRLSDAHEALTRLMGLCGPRRHWRLEAPLAELPDSDPDPSALEHQALSQSLELQATAHELTRVADRLGISAPLAALDGAALGAATEREYDGTWGIGPALSIPLPVFDTGHAADLTAQSQLRRLQATYLAQALEIRSRLRLTWQHLLAMRARVGYLTSVVLPLRRLELEQLVLAYNGMLVDPFALLAGRSRQLEADHAVQDATAGYWLARADLEELRLGHLPAAGSRPPLRDDEDALPISGETMPDSPGAP